jgi:two-component system, chemotaxis family, sensor kinase CheA
MGKNNYSEEEIEIIAEELETEHDLKVLNECWHISIHPRKEFGKIFPYPQIKSLNTIGKAERVKVVTDGIPSFYKFNPEFCYLGFETSFKSSKNKTEIENIFIPIKNEFKIRILPPNSNISDYIALIDELSDKNRRVGEILKEIGSLTEFELEEVLFIQKEYSAISSNKKEQKHLGELLVNERIIQEPVIKAALQKQEKIRNTN